MNGIKSILKRISVMSLAVLLIAGSVNYGVLEAKAEENTESDTGAITSVTVSPNTGVIVQKGKTLQFTATVNGTGSYDNTVTWSVQSQSSDDTTISQDGLLTVAEDETMVDILVTATANGNPEISVSVGVMIPQSTSITLSKNFWYPTAVGDKLTLTAVIPDRYDNAMWSISSDGLVSFDGSYDLTRGDEDKTIDTTVTVVINKPGKGVVTIAGNSSTDSSTFERADCIIQAGNEIVIQPDNGKYEYKVDYTFTNTYKLPDYEDCGFTVPEGKQFKAWEVNGQEYSAGQTIQIFANEGEYTSVNINAVWTEDSPTTITEVTGLPDVAGIRQGGTHKFTAEVKGTDTFDDTLIWKVEGANSANTRIDQDGNLTIGDDETATSFIVRAVANGDVTKSDTAIVTVIKKDVEITTDVKVKVEAGTPETKVEGLDEGVAIALLDASELARVGAGENLSIYLKAEKLEETAAPADDKAKTDEMAATISNLKQGVYLDLSMWKKIGGDSEQKLSDTQTAKKLKIVIDLPDELKAPSGEVRTYYVIRVHGGQATLLPVEVNGSEISFETDMFSTYSVWYTETAASEPSDNGGSTSGDSGNGDHSDSRENQNNTTDTGSNTANDNSAAYVPKTGDQSKMVFWSMLLLISAVALAEVTAKRKRG